MARYMKAPLDATIEELNIYTLLYKKADFNSWLADYTLEQLAVDSHRKLDLSVKMVRRIIDKLVNLGYIEVVKKGSKGNPTIYKVKSYAIYEDEGQLKGKQRADKGQLKDTNDEPIPTLIGEVGQSKGNQRATKGQTKGNPIIKSKKETEINKDIESSFEQVYSLFSRKGGKQDALNSYVKLLKDYTHEQLLECVKIFNQSDKSKGEYAYQANNFFGKKAYYKDYLPKPPVIKPINELTIEDIPPSFQHWERGKDVTLEAYNRGKLYAYKESLKDDN